jgi:tRNA modification GTPase
VSSAFDTIAAIATAPGSGGVAIVRVSGPDACAIVGSIFPHPAAASGFPEERRIYVGHLLDRPAGAIVDRVVAFAMRAPRSYTGEDVVEIQCHGGSLVSQRVLESVCAAGARPAEPGEFTKRAFLNGRIDLAQAEAVADLIMARSESGRRLAHGQLTGALSARVNALREALVRTRALCEVSLDFADEDIPESTVDEIAVELGRVRRELAMLVQSFERGRLRYHGARVALVGRPNVGKSSLLNALAGRERALVTPIAGTTRDIVEAAIVVRDAPVTLMDTAGLRETSDVVEVLGVGRTRSAIEEAACVVAIFDRGAPLGTEDRGVVEAVRGRSIVVVLNKCDLPAATDAASVRALFGAVPVVEVSAVDGTRLAELVAEIGRAVFDRADGGRDDEIMLFRERHRDAARRAVQALERAEFGLSSAAPLELVASDLAAATDALAEITGIVTSEDVLDRVFADFCLGK